MDTGCYSADVNPFPHMGGFQITHVVGDSPLGPFVGAQIAAPPTHYNPHAYYFDDGSTTGLYVLYTNGGALRKAARVQHQLEQGKRRCRYLQWDGGEPHTSSACICDA